MLKPFVALFQVVHEELPKISYQNFKVQSNKIILGGKTIFAKCRNQIGPNRMYEVLIFL